jgi:hypothetical protein
LSPPTLNNLLFNLSTGGDETFSQVGECSAGFKNKEGETLKDLAFFPKQFG